MGARLFTSSRRLLLLAAAGLSLVGPGPTRADSSDPKVKAYPAALPISGVKADGTAQSVRATADLLKRSVTKACPDCGGKGTVRVRGGAAGFVRPDASRCDKCDGKGQVPNDPERVNAAALNLVAAIVRMPPNAGGADAALRASYESIATNLLKGGPNFAEVQRQSQATLAQVKPPTGKVVLVKAVYLNETKHPTSQGEVIHLLRIAGKQQLVAVVSPKQADPPESGGHALLGGVVAGMAEPEMRGGGTARVMILERGFLIAPTADASW